MKKRGLTACLSGLLAVLLALCGCADPDQLQYDNDTRQYVRAGDGAVFYRAPSNYLAVRILTDREVGSIGQEEAEDLSLYVIADYEETATLDPDEYMADDAYNVYYAEGVTLPRLWEMDVNLIRIVKAAAVSYSAGVIEDATEVAAVINVYQNGTAFAYNDADCNFRIREGETRQLAFSSPTYGGFYYVLYYYRFDESVELTQEVESFDNFTPAYAFPYSLEEAGGKTYARYDLGKNFLYDRATGLCYPMGDVVASHFNFNS